MTGAAATLLSVNVGMPKEVSWQGRTVRTGAWKHPVAGPVMVRRLNVDGDGQGDLAGHGGEQRVVLVYQLESYQHWREQFGRDDLDYGSFGENLTVDGLPDDEVCIGDRYRIGDAEFEVTQPRVTCYRVGLRLGVPEMAALLVGHHRPGFYMRVLRVGRIQAGDQIVKTKDGPDELSVAATDALLYLPDRDRDGLRRAVDIPAMSPGWRQSFRELLDGGAASRPAWSGFRELRVAKVVPESADVSSIYLTAPDGGPLPAAQPGQYVTVRIPGTVRSYSLSSAPGAPGYRISVKHEPHGVGSTYLTTAVHAGDLVNVAAPRGDFVLTPGAGPVLLISAGIGVTPVLAMLHDLAARRSDREIWWIHAARGPSEHPLDTEARALLDSLPNTREHIFYSQATPAECHRAHAHSGRLSKSSLTELSLPLDATAYLCGPQAFMTEMAGVLAAAGLEPVRVHTEIFGALPPINPGLVGRAAVPPHLPPGPPGAGPLVTFARSGITTPFTDDRRNLLDLAEACDVPARWSCRTGVCHTCETPALSGAVTYSPDPLESPAEGDVLICSARPDGDLVLDM
jgi:ferredoxin-NADP reductase/MOSC domain-containing protein YiiM